MADVPLTWLGHAAFRFDTPGGKRVYVDPWLTNPKIPDAEKEPERIDVIAITHGHDDHVGDTIELAQKFECVVVAPVEIADWLVWMKEAVPEDRIRDPNKGGTVDLDGVKVTLTDANHSSSTFEDDHMVYLGEPVGLVFEVENGTKLYFAGDTNVFGDMQLIRRLYAPDVAILPIGGHYTMDPGEAAVALEFLGVQRCVPCHYGTFPKLAGTPDELRELAPGVEVLSPEPGETITV
jgi:L-ascorbate metabolism protein UlaG (beta-lactamase superfamily)